MPFAFWKRSDHEDSISFCGGDWIICSCLFVAWFRKKWPGNHLISFVELNSTCYCYSTWVKLSLVFHSCFLCRILKTRGRSFVTRSWRRCSMVKIKSGFWRLQNCWIRTSLSLNAPPGVTGFKWTSLFVCYGCPCLRPWSRIWFKCCSFMHLLGKMTFMACQSESYDFCSLQLCLYRSNWMFCLSLWHETQVHLKGFR